MIRFFSTFYFFLSSALPALAGLSDAVGQAADVAGRAGFETAETKADPITIVGVIINAILGLIGIVFTLLIIHAGVQWMTAKGNDEAVNQAQKTILNSILGLAVTLGAWAIYLLVRSYILT